MNKRKRLLAEKIGKEAVRVDWELAFGGKSFGNHHLERVNKIVNFLQSKEGGDLFVIEVGGWVHDVSLVYGPDDDGEKIRLRTREFLDGFPKLGGDEKNMIVDCAVGHEDGLAMTIEAKIVHDGDVIDKSGMLGVIRHIWKMTNLLEKRLLVGENDLDILIGHLKARKARLFTKTAKDLVEKLDLGLEMFIKDGDFALKVLPLISEMAFGAMTSDKIAENLRERFVHPCLDALENQLLCEYLENIIS